MRSEISAHSPPPKNTSHFVFDKPAGRFREEQSGVATTLFNPNLEYFPTNVRGEPIICYDSPYKPFGPKPKSREWPSDDNLVFRENRTQN